MLNPLLLLQTFQSNFDPVQFAESPSFELVQNGLSYGPMAYLVWGVTLVLAQILGAFAIHGAAKHAEKIDGSRQLIFPPFVWGLIALISGPTGLLGTALLLWWLGYAPYTRGSDTAGSQLVKRSAPGGGVGSAQHRARVAQLRAELEDLENQEPQPNDDPGGTVP